MYESGCQCGEVRLSFNGSPMTCYACHCTDCQTSSGSAFTLSMILKRDDIKVIQGELAINRFQHNGHEIERHHCGNCGTAFWFAGEGFPGIVAFKPGTFDDNSWFTPVAHIWMRSTQPWLKIDSNCATFQEQPDLKELIKLHRKLNQ